MGEYRQASQLSALNVHLSFPLKKFFFNGNGVTEKCFLDYGTPQDIEEVASQSHPVSILLDFEMLIRVHMIQHFKERYVYFLGGTG